MSSRENKRRKKTTQKQSPDLVPTQNMSLPEDLLVSCLARVSRLYYPILSLVSKRLRSLLASKYVIETRSSLGRSESCLYVSLVNYSVPSAPNPRWFTLCRKPRDTKKSSGYVLAATSSLDYPQTSRKSMVAVGSDIYYIGDIEKACSSKKVSILDCRTNTWRKAPNMHKKRNSPAVNVFDGKIYVTGGRKDLGPYTIEIFYPKTQTWELKLTCIMEYVGSSIRIHEFHGTIFIYGYGIGNGNHNGFVYRPKRGLGERMRLTELGAAYCVIQDVLYCYDIEFKWFDTKVKRWVHLKGVKGLPKLPRDCVRLADYGGKMVVLWEKIVGVTGDEKKQILCGVIALERRNSEETWGKVEWYEVVLTVPNSHNVEHVLAVTL